MSYSRKLTYPKNMRKRKITFPWEVASYRFQKKGIEKRG